MPLENEERQSSTPGIHDSSMNPAFSDSHTSEVSMHSVTNMEDSVHILSDPGTVSDSEDYLRTRSFSESNSPDTERNHYVRRPLTPQAPVVRRSFAIVKGKFSQRCINHNRHGELPDTDPDHDDALDIKPEQEQVPPFSFRNFDRKKKILAASLALTNFAAMFCLSVMAPFFPQEASYVGVSSTISGWIFGVFALVQFLTSPFFGKLLPRLGAWFLYQAGLFLAAGCTVLFGYPLTVAIRFFKLFERSSIFAASLDCTTKFKFRRTFTYAAICRCRYG